jgi:hypothetical protein
LTDCRRSFSKPRKKLAATFGGKSAHIMNLPEAERLSGYKAGGFGFFQPAWTL